MASITTINASDLITNSRTVINTNLANLNTDKIETSVIDTDTTLAANSDSKIPSQKAVKAYVDAGGDPLLVNYLVPTGGILPYAGSSVPANFLLCNGQAVSRATYSALFAKTSTTFGSGDGSTTFNVPNLVGRIPLGYGTGTKVFTFVSRSSNTITASGMANSVNNENQTGQAFVYHTSGSVITGLTNDVTYYVIRTAYNTFQLASSLANALAGTAISLSSDGSGTQTFTSNMEARALGDTGGEESHALSTTELQHTTSVTTQNNGNAAGGSSVPWVTAVGAVSPSTAALHDNMQPFLALNYIIKY